MKQILAFGDSNTWGMIPGTIDRYPEYTRWTGILRRIVTPKGYRILEDGVVGRTTVFEDPARPFRKGIDSIVHYRSTENLHAVILMLGTNDCKKALHNTPEQIGGGIEQCISRFIEFIPPEKILVLSPILLGENVWRPDKDPAFDRQSVETSAALKETYRIIAAKRGCLFLAASDCAAPSPVDEEHLSVEGHVHLASAILKKLAEAGLL